MLPGPGQLVMLLLLLLLLLLMLLLLLLLILLLLLLLSCPGNSHCRRGPLLLGHHQHSVLVPGSFTLLFGHKENLLPVDLSDHPLLDWVLHGFSNTCPV